MLYSLLGDPRAIATFVARKQVACLLLLHSGGGRAEEGGGGRAEEATYQEGLHSSLLSAARTLVCLSGVQVLLDHECLDGQSLLV